MKGESQYIDMTTEERRVRDFGLIFYLWFLLTLAAYAFGAYSIYQLIINNTAVVNWVQEQFNSAYALLGNYLWWGLGAAVVLFLVGVIFAYLQVWLMSYIGAEIINTVVFGIPLVLTGAGIASFFLFSEVWIGIVFIVPAAFLLFIAVLVGKRVVLGAKIFEMSNEAVNDEKSSLTPVFFFATLSLFTFILGFAAAAFTGANISDWVSNQWLEYLVFFVLIYVYLMIHYTMLHFSDAINICIFKRWNNYKDSSLKIAIREIWKVKGSIVLFGMFIAFFDAIIKTIQFFANRKFFKGWKKNKVISVTMKVLRIVFFIFILILKGLFKILKFLNYYTLTLIVVEKQGFIRSVARSADLSLDSAADIIIGKTGVSIAKGLFSLLTLGVFSTGGFFLGYYWLADQLGIPDTVFFWNISYKVGFSILVALIFFLFGYLPTSAILRPISTAYKTILFFHIADPFRGHTGRRTRISPDIQKNIDGIQSEVMETYDKEERPTWQKPEEAKA
ncbi:MAG: hypothetical protein HeimAB125_04630 [Candidatus Heimdallarchaeota archaeon AB_125]|nr:MAG: hypothetical protein HeimAB125_04630 [Candidatus Heimdallarchaeota archaeon AB_125]